MLTVQAMPRLYVILVVRVNRQQASGWLGGSVVERLSLIGELSLVCTGPAADG